MKCIDCNADIIKDGPSPSDYVHDKGNCFYYFRHKIEQLNEALTQLVNENIKMYNELKGKGYRN